MAIDYLLRDEKDLTLKEALQKWIELQKKREFLNEEIEKMTKSQYDIEAESDRLENIYGQEEHLYWIEGSLLRTGSGRIRFTVAPEVL
jgi:hypothetical protein